MTLNMSTAKDFIELLTKIEKQFGPLIGAAIGRIFQKHTTITYTDTQAQGFLTREISAMQQRADDLERASR